MLLQREKILQAIELLKEEQMDMWVTIGRETMMNSDPVIPMISPFEFGGLTAAIICRSGENILIANHLDAGGFQVSDVYDKVIQYDHYDIFPTLKEIIQKIKPEKIALNYSDDVAADGLTVGLYNKVMQFLKKMSFSGTVCSSEKVIFKLRGQKSPIEIERMKKSIQVTMAIFEDLKAFIKPGISDIDIFNFCKMQMKKHDVTDAWDTNMNPMVSIRNDSVDGHAGATGLLVEEGDIIRLDFGVKKDGYCSDLQRVFYVPKSGEKEIPKDVVAIFEAVKKGIRLGAEHMQIGVAIDVPDTLVKKYLSDSNLPMYNHSLGHQIGMFAHDGGLSMSKRSVDIAKENELPYHFIENMVYTLEFACKSSRGVCGQEEMLVIRANGPEWLSEPQEAIYLCSTT